MGNDKNSFAEAARGKKVTAFVRYLDRRFIAVGRCPYREARELAEMLRDSVSEEQWAQHATVAGLRKPIATTVALVIKQYEDRAAEREAESVRKYTGTH